MGSAPQNQVFLCTVETSLPATILSTDDAINFLNTPGSGFWNDTLGAIYTIGNMGNSSITASSVTNSNWIAQNGHAALEFHLNITSDPVSATEIQEIIYALAGIAMVAIGAAIAMFGPPGWAVDIVGIILALAGVITLLNATVTEISSSPVLSFGVIALGIGVIAGVGILAYSAYKSPETRQNLVKAGQSASRVAAKGAQYAATRINA